MPLEQTAMKMKKMSMSPRHGPSRKRVVTRGRPKTAMSQVGKKMSALDRAKYSGHGGY